MILSDNINRELWLKFTHHHMGIILKKSNDIAAKIEIKNNKQKIVYKMHVLFQFYV